MKHLPLILVHQDIVPCTEDDPNVMLYLSLTMTWCSNQKAGVESPYNIIQYCGQAACCQLLATQAS